MAKKVRNEVAVGLTTLVVLVLAIYIVIVLGDWSNLFTNQHEITVRLPYETGLKGLGVNSPILLGGAKIGQITDAHIDVPAEETAPRNVYVYFTMKLPEKYPIRSDCILSVQSNLLGGQALLAIKDLGQKGEFLTGDRSIDLPADQFEGGITETFNVLRGELNSDDPESLLGRIKSELNRDNPDAFITQLARTAENLNHITLRIREEVECSEEKQTLMVKLHRVMDRMTSITTHLDEELDREQNAAAMAKVHIALDALDDALGQVDELVRTNKQPVTETVASLRNITGQIEQETPDLLSKVKTTLDQAAAAMTRAEQTLAEVKTLVQANREQIDQVIANVHEVSVNLKMASRDIRRSPWRLVYKPKKDELELAGLIESASDFATGAEKLDETALRLQALMEAARSSDKLDEEQLQKLMQELQETFDQFRRAEEKFWNEMNTGQ
ncbi:MAG: hypothetical protein JW709_05550 [Sedimentisphaerales bacterium]|nr:hypothetical protein [Sedimentisphaerales bacterium]